MGDPSSAPPASYRTVAYDNDNLGRLRAERIRSNTGPWSAWPSAALPTIGGIQNGDILYDVSAGYSDNTGYDKVGNRRSRTASGVTGVSTTAYATYDSNIPTTASAAHLPYMRREKGSNHSMVRFRD